MYPKNKYANIIENKLETINLENFKTFKYNPDPEVLTGEIETMTNYDQRKKIWRLERKFLKTKKMKPL